MTTSTKSVEEEIKSRHDAMRQAIALTEIAGGTVSDNARAIMERYANGELNAHEMDAEIAAFAKSLSA